MSRLGFTIEKEVPGSEARNGHFRTLHSEVRTPIFMPVGTQATVKGQTLESLQTSGSQVLLANTYHLLLRPGPEVFRKLGGIHRFMNWPGSILTDSGGFQIFSLPGSRQMKEEGATFQSYVDGKTYLLSPEVSIDMQKSIGSDIMMVLDQCVPSTVEHAEAQAAMELTHRWAGRSLAARGDSPASLFGIVQGATFEDLRRQSAEFLTQLPFDGFAIGGLAVGETKNERDDFTEFTARLLPRHLPRYLMGVGTPLDILEAVHRGVDMFDCILPSQIAQRGGAYTSQGRLQLRRTQYKFSEEPLDPDCGCVTCRSHSRAYLHHLHKTGETLGWHLLTVHNLTYYHRLMRTIRAQIAGGTFLEFYRSEREKLMVTDNTHATHLPVAPGIGDYEVVASSKGFSSIRQKSSGEVMHSVSEPTEEARRLYVEQSGLREKLLESGAAPLVIWDVGLGAATNAMAVLHLFESLPSPRPVRLISFENDLNSLRLALKHPEEFPYLKHPAPAALLSDSTWTRGDFTWELRRGDFQLRLNSALQPDLIFYDPFSSKTNPELWTPEVFTLIAEHCAGKFASLFTYSSSTAVRAALLSAGFFVGKGLGTGPKAETTVAQIGAENLGSRLLDKKWLERWGRSHTKFPETIVEPMRPAFEIKILSHPQFS